MRPKWKEEEDSGQVKRDSLLSLEGREEDKEAKGQDERAGRRGGEGRRREEGGRERKLKRAREEVGERGWGGQWASELISCRVAERGGASREVRCARQEARGTEKDEYEMVEEGKEG